MYEAQNSRVLSDLAAKLNIKDFPQQWLSLVPAILPVADIDHSLHHPVMRRYSLTYLVATGNQGIISVPDDHEWELLLAFISRTTGDATFTALTLTRVLENAQTATGTVRIAAASSGYNWYISADEPIFPLRMPEQTLML